MYIGWLIALVILIIIEIFNKGLVSIWFIASGIVALIVSFFVSSFYIQFLIFGVLGIILMLTTRSKLESLFNNIVGQNGVVVKTIKKGDVGEVLINGKTYIATSEKRILKNSNVVVLSKNKNTLVVERINKK